MPRATPFGPLLQSILQRGRSAFDVVTILTLELRNDVLIGTVTCSAAELAAAFAQTSREQQSHSEEERVGQAEKNRFPGESFENLRRCLYNGKVQQYPH